MTAIKIESNKRPEFTILKAMKYQADGLAKWKELLSPKVYEALRLWVKKQNKNITDAYSVTRGQNLTNFVVNYPLRTKVTVEIIDDNLPEYALYIESGQQIARDFETSKEAEEWANDNDYKVVDLFN